MEEILFILHGICFFLRTQAKQSKAKRRSDPKHLPSFFCSVTQAWPPRPATCWWASCCGRGGWISPAGSWSATSPPSSASCSTPTQRAAPTPPSAGGWRTSRPPPTRQTTSWTSSVTRRCASVPTPRSAAPPPHARSLSHSVCLLLEHRSLVDPAYDFHHAARVFRPNRSRKCFMGSVRPERSSQRNFFIKHQINCTCHNIHRMKTKIDSTYEYINSQATHNTTVIIVTTNIRIQIIITTPNCSNLIRIEMDTNGDLSPPTELPPMLNKIKSAVYESSDEYDEEELQSIYNVHTSRKELHRNGQTKMRSKIEHHPERASPKWPNPNAIQNRALAGMSFIRTYLAGNKPHRASLSPPAGPRKEPKRQAPARIHGAGGGGGTQQRGFAAAASRSGKRKPAEVLRTNRKGIRQNWVDSRTYGGIGLADAGPHKKFSGMARFEASVPAGDMKWILQTGSYYNGWPDL